MVSIMRNIWEVVDENEISLEYASEELRNDREIVLEAIKNSGYAILYASEELQKDRNFIMKAVKECGYIYIKIHIRRL